MRELVAIVVVFFMGLGCKKPNPNDVRDYHFLRGKWKFLYQMEGYPSTIKYFPDSYELEFTDNYRLKRLKGGKCEGKAMVQSCDVNNYPLQRDANLDLDDGNLVFIDIQPNDPDLDTLVFKSYYPINVGFVYAVYIREK